MAQKFSSLQESISTARQMLAITYKVRPIACVLFAIGAVLETAASILTIYASAKLVGLLAQFINNGSTDGIWFWLWTDIAAAAITGFGFWLMAYSKRLVYFAMNKWSVDVFMNALSRIDIGDFYNDEIRNQINKADSGYTWQIPNLSYHLLDLLYGLLRFAAIAVVVAQIGWWLVLVIAIFLIPTLISDARIAGISWSIWENKGDNRHIFSGITNMMNRPRQQMEIRSMQTGPYLLDRVSTINTEFYGEQEKSYRKANKFSLTANFFEVGGIAVGSIVLLRQFLTGALSLDRYFFLSGALLRVGGALNSIFGTLSTMQDSLQFTRHFLAVTTLQPTITDTTNPHQLADSTPPTIEFKNVTFTYPGQSKPTFKNLNLTISAGQHIALVGENGAGKSTLIKLLMRFYIPDSGTIVINGINLNDIAIDTWYTQVASLFQNFNEYPLSIEENVTISRPSANKNKHQLQQAAQFGGVDELITGYKHGWDTVLDASFEKGVEPSGGQWQRVALARAFFRNANVLILDEPTAAIDAKAEYDIFNNIFDHYLQKTAIIVSHRFSTVRRANTILVIEKGTIIEQGSHGELMKLNGAYCDLFTKQAEGYKD